MGAAGEKLPKDACEMGPGRNQSAEGGAVGAKRWRLVPELVGSFVQILSRKPWDLGSSWRPLALEMGRLSAQKKIQHWPWPVKCQPCGYQSFAYRRGMGILWVGRTSAAVKETLLDHQRLPTPHMAPVTPGRGSHYPKKREG